MSLAVLYNSIFEISFAYLKLSELYLLDDFEF